jgi:hypothetical protein
VAVGWVVETVDGRVGVWGAWKAALWAESLAELMEETMVEWMDRWLAAELVELLD